MNSQGSSNRQPRTNARDDAPPPADRSAHSPWRHVRSDSPSRGPESAGSSGPFADSPAGSPGFFRTALDGCEDAFWAIDPEARELVFANSVLRDRWDLDARDFSGEGRGLLERVVSSERRATAHALKRGLRSGALEFRTTLRDRDGVPRLVRIWGALELWPGAGRPLFVGWVRDLAREDELTQMVETYRTASETDPLTGVLNRRGLERAMGHAVGREGVQGNAAASESSAVLIDLDDFKVINDQYGHYVGDRVLEIAARRLESGLRSTDLLGRIGGDEFLVVLPGTDSQSGYEVAQRMRRAMRGSRLRVDGFELELRASLALTPLQLSPEVGVDDALLLVRRLMAAAKHRGKDAVATPKELTGGWPPIETFPN